MTSPPKTSPPKTKLDHALFWQARTGLAIFPLVPGGKEPLPGSRGHLDATTDPDTIRAMWTDPLSGAVQDYNIGTTPRGRHVIIDLDVKDGRNGIANYLALGGELKGLVTSTPSGGRHIYLESPDTNNTVGKIGHGIDSRGSAGYVLAPGSRKDGIAYEIILDDPMATIAPAILDRIPLRLAAPRAVTTYAVESDQPRNIARAIEVAQRAEPAFSGAWHDIGFRLGCELCRVGLSPEAAVEVAAEHWVPRGTGFKDRDQFERDILGGYHSAAHEHGAHSIDAQLAAFVGVEIVPQPPTVDAAPGAGPTDTTAAQVPGLHPFSDSALAHDFTRQSGDRFLFVADLSRWHRWSGAHWARDDTTTVYSEIRRVCEAASVTAAATPGCESLALPLASATTVSAVERLARSDPRHARISTQFDCDPWSLNTPGGLLDLRTGGLRPPNPTDLHTKITGATPGGECPRFLAFLDDITQGNTELAAYIQRFAGYTLTGEMREHAFLFALGPGGNGKGTLFGAIAAALGDYATTAAPTVFTSAPNSHDGHLSRIAVLRGARMVQVTETEEGHQWNEARLKAWVGGDKQSANLMRGDLFEFAPLGKLWVSGNHPPMLRNPDAAMRRRLNLVPLNYVPPAPDTGLHDALRGELDGILAWAVQGCLDWQGNGLQRPQAVTQATNEYFAGADLIGTWLAEDTERDPNAQTASRALYVAWNMWCIATGERSGTEKAFGQSIRKHYDARRTNAGIVFAGLRLRTPVEVEPAPNEFPPPAPSPRSGPHPTVVPRHV